MNLLHSDDPDKLNLPGPPDVVDAAKQDSPADEREPSDTTEPAPDASEAPDDPSGGEAEEEAPPTVEELEAMAADLLETGNVLADVEAQLEGRYAGPTHPVKLLVLALSTRHLDKPVSVALRGESSAGKSYAIKTAAAFAAPEACHEMTAMSPKALFYSRENLEHRMLLIFEGEGISSDIASYAVRSLLSEGKLKYEVTDVESQSTIKINKDGPTGLILSTAGRLDYELSTRMLSVSIDDSPAVTAAILRVEALAAAGSASVPDLGAFHALDRLIALEAGPVLIPYAVRLAELTDRRAVRLRRDFGSLLGLIKGHALLHYRQRERGPDGEIIATLADYAVVHGLVADVLAHASGRSVPAEVREAVEAVEILNAENPPGETTIARVADYLNRDRSTASRRLNRALGMGFLQEVSGPYRKQKVFQPGEPLPDDVGVLPSPAELEEA